jgi:hypothetical protein
MIRSLADRPSWFVSVILVYKTDMHATFLNPGESVWREWSILMLRCIHQIQFWMNAVKQSAVWTDIVAGFSFLLSYSLGELLAHILVQQDRTRPDSSVLHIITTASVTWQIARGGGGRQIPPWVLGTLLEEAVKLARGGRLI